MTPTPAPEVLTTLLSLFGAGGATAIIVGFLAYKTAALKGRREPMKPEDLSTPGALPGSHDIELLANASSSLAAAISRLALLCEFQFVEKADRRKEFEEWSEHRVLEEEVAALRAAQKR